MSITHTLTTTATSSAHLEDLAYLDEQRHTPLRTSLRMPRQSTTCGPGRSGQDLRGESCREHTHTNTQTQTHTPSFPSSNESCWKNTDTTQRYKVLYWILSRDKGVLVYLCLAGCCIIAEQLVRFWRETFTVCDSPLSVVWVHFHCQKKTNKEK